MALKFTSHFAKRQPADKLGIFLRSLPRIKEGAYHSNGKQWPQCKQRPFIGQKIVAFKMEFALLLGVNKSTKNLKYA